MAMSTPVSCYPCTFGTSGIITLFPLFAYIFLSVDSSRSTLSVFGILPPGTASRRRLRVQSIVTHQCRENSAAKGRQMFTWVLGSGGWEPEH